jgi:hypothetical protein
MDRRLRRPREPMPAWVRRGPRGIAGAKQAATKQGRLAQMLDELDGGERYMKLSWRPRAPEPQSGSLAS